MLYILLKFIEMLWTYKKFLKIGVGSGVGQVRTKHLLAQTVWKSSFSSLHFHDPSIFGKSSHLAQKCYFYLETTNKQSCKLFKVELFNLIKSAE